MGLGLDAEPKDLRILLCQDYSFYLMHCRHALGSPGKVFDCKDFAQGAEYTDYFLINLFILIGG